MLKVLIISNNIAYNNELKRSAMISDVDILAICFSQDDVRKRLNSGMRPDVIIASDVLFPGSSVEGLVSDLQQFQMLDRTYFILRSAAKSDFLIAHNIQYALEVNCTPQELLDMVKNPIIASGTSYEDLDERIVEDTQTKNMANILAAETANKKKASMGIEEDMPRETVLTNRGAVGAFKSIMVAINSPKGGVGKTAISIELAFLLAARAKEVDFNPSSKLQYAKKVSVCLVDMNPSLDTMAATLKCVRNTPTYPTVSDWVTKIEEKIFNNMSEEEKQLLMEDENHDFGPFINEAAIRFTREEIESLLVHDEQTGLYILPSIALPFDVEYVKPQYIRIILTQIRAMFDISIVDTGNNISFFTVESMRQANEVFLVSTPTSGSSVVLGKLIKNLNRLNVDRSKFSLVLNYPNGDKSELDADTITNVLKLTLLQELPFDENMKMAHEEGIPYSIYHKKTPFAREATKLAQQIYPLWSTVSKRGRKPAVTASPAAKKGGLFAKFGK